VTFDLYAWKSPRDLDADAIEALLEEWQAAGGDPATSPFEPSSDVGWFYLELTKDEPELGASSDALPSTSKTPIWLGTTPDPPPARVVRIPLTAETQADVLDFVYGLAAKYDLVVYDPRNRGIHLPLEELADYASATFWPGGAIQAAVAGGIGLVIAIVAWFLGIPVLSGIAIVIGGFLFVMAVYTFIHEGRKAMKARRAGGEPPTGG
jgi:hypothetical protein